jgi:hypothetical protein
VQALADMAIFDFFSEIIAWWEAIDMFWGGMLASKVVFSPSSHRLLLPEDVSRAEFFHERVWYFIILFLIWYCMNSERRWCYGHSSMISQTFRTNQNPSWSKILEQWN